MTSIHLPTEQTRSSVHIMDTVFSKASRFEPLRVSDLRYLRITFPARAEDYIKYLVNKHNAVVDQRLQHAESKDTLSANVSGVPNSMLEIQRDIFIDKLSCTIQAITLEGRWKRVDYRIHHGEMKVHHSSSDDMSMPIQDIAYYLNQGTAHTMYALTQRIESQRLHTLPVVFTNEDHMGANRAALVGVVMQ